MECRLWRPFSFEFHFSWVCVCRVRSGVRSSVPELADIPVGPTDMACSRRTEALWDKKKKKTSADRRHTHSSPSLLTGRPVSRVRVIQGRVSL